MKKVYLLFVLCCLGLSNFAATWYANTGAADNVANWWSSPTFTGTHPVTFATPGDVWNVNGNMTTVGSWAVGGTLELNSGTFSPNGDITVGTAGTGGDLTLNGSVLFSPADGSDLTLTLFGNLNVFGTASWNNEPAWTHIHFANTASSLALPQYINWTSTATSYYTGVNVDSGAVVRLLTSFTVPGDGTAFDGDDMPEYISGTLVCDSFSINFANDTVVVDSGATIYTMNPGGIDSTFKMSTSDTFNSASNYVFNGFLPQVTGLKMPVNFTAGGSLTISNAAGVMLSQTTIIGDGASLNLVSGALTLWTNNLALGAAANLTGTFSSSAMIVTNYSGAVTKIFNTGGDFTFPVGDNTPNYTPITLSVAGSSFTPGASVSVTVTDTMDPHNANMTNHIERYWSVTSSGISGFSCIVDSANYVATDVTGIESMVSAGAYPTAIPWLKFGPADTINHKLTSTAISNPVFDFSGITTAGPMVTSSADTALCTGGMANLSVISMMGDGPLSYSWAPAAGLSATTGMMVMAMPTATTVYTVTITDGNGFTGMAMTSVTVNAYPNVDTVTGGGPYCAGGTGVHIGLNTTDTGVSYQLFYDASAFGSAVSGLGTTLDFGLETGAGTYYVVATGIHTGCTITMAGERNVSITPLFFPFVHESASHGDTLCAGTMNTFTASHSLTDTLINYQWIVNGANVGTDTSAYTYAPADGNIVVIKLTSGRACATPSVVMDTMIMHVYTNDTPYVYVAPAPASTVCAGSMVTLTATPYYGGTTPTYTWVKDSVAMATTPTYSFMPANGDNVYCVMNSNYRCRLGVPPSYSNIVNFTTVVPVVPSVTIAARPGTFITSGTPDTLVATVVNGGTAPLYQWYVNNVSVPAATSNTFIRSTYSNNDSVTCMVTRQDACALSAVNSVIINTHPVGVAQVGAAIADVQLIPNPNNGVFTVKGNLNLTGSEQVSLTVVNLLGQILYNTNATVQNGDLNETVNVGRTLPSGIYMLNIGSSAGATTIRFEVAR